MYNLRYHVVSLVAVFLALSVGLLLGTVVVERGVLDSQKSSLVDSLQSEFKSIREENDRLRTELGREQSFASAAAAPLIAEKLKDRTVLLVVNAGRTDGLSDGVEALEAAGAEVVVAAFAAERLDLGDPAVSQEMTAVVGDVSGGGELEQKVAEKLASEWRNKGPRPVTQALLQTGKLTLDRFDKESVADGCVVLASWNGRPDAMALRLGQELRRSGATVVGAQTQRRDTGVAAAAGELGFDTVDHLGTPEGSVSMVWLLSGAAKGRYGVGAGVDGLFPNLR